MKMSKLSVRLLFKVKGSPFTEQLHNLTPDSWGISGTSVTMESKQRFLYGYVIFEGYFEKLVRVILAKVWANFARGQNPKWPPGGHHKNYFFYGLGYSVDQHMLSGVLGAKEFIFDINFMIRPCYD